MGDFWACDHMHLCVGPAQAMKSFCCECEPHSSRAKTTPPRELTLNIDTGHLAGNFHTKPLLVYYLNQQLHGNCEGVVQEKKVTYTSVTAYTTVNRDYSTFKMNPFVRKLKSVSSSLGIQTTL